MYEFAHYFIFAFLIPETDNHHKTNDHPDNNNNKKTDHNSVLVYARDNESICNYFPCPGSCPYRLGRGVMEYVATYVTIDMYLEPYEALF